MSTKSSKYFNTFHSKIMLFGEYSIILGSMGLTIPYAHFNGSLDFINKNKYTDLDFARRSNKLLKSYLTYIENLKEKDLLPSGFDYEGLKNDINNGLYFESSIPEGYGLGSSGALVAAIYYAYKSDNVKPRRASAHKELSQIKKELATLESWFHGTSSGIDPLICFMKHPLLINENQDIAPIGIPRYNLTNQDAIFLINSGKPGKTAPLVDQFMENCSKQEYLKMMKEQYIPLNNQSIGHLINGDIDQFSNVLQKLSKFQLSQFSDMIPKSFEKDWMHGIDTGKYLLKLCGSGGGGFILGFTRNYSEVKEHFNDKNTDLIPVYQTIK